jgi:hypothetical protein
MGGRTPWNYWGVITEIKGALIYTKRQLWRLYECVDLYGTGLSILPCLNHDDIVLIFATSHLACVLLWEVYECDRWLEEVYWCELGLADIMAMASF